MQRIVGDVVRENVRHAGRPGLALDEGVVSRCGEYLVEFNACRIGRLPEVVKDDVLDLDIDIGLCDVTLERGNCFVFLLLADDSLLDVRIQEVKSDCVWSRSMV